MTTTSPSNLASTLRACVRPGFRLAAVLIGISSDRFDRVWLKFSTMSRSERTAQIHLALDAALDRLDAPADRTPDA